MSGVDVLMILCIIGGGLYGAGRGVRPALYLVVALLASLLALILFTRSYESLLMNRILDNLDAFDGVPAVTVFILEGRTGAAFLAAAFPMILVAASIAILLIGYVLFRPFIVAPSRHALSRWGGGFFGIAAGAVFSLIIAVQLVRLPWPPAADWLRGGLLTAFVNRTVGALVLVPAGGW